METKTCKILTPVTYYLNLLPSMAAVYPWFYTCLFKPAGTQPAGPLILPDDSNKVKTILQINKDGTHTKVKLIGYSSLYNQYT